ncbi:hypothetical protein Q3C01_07305 [Bradyrhizobium sp. UFLA05-109]
MRRALAASRHRQLRAHRVLFDEETAKLAAVEDVGELTFDKPVLGAAFAGILKPISQLSDDVFQFDLFGGLRNVRRETVLVIKVFANVDAAEKWFEENDPEGVAFE